MFKSKIAIIGAGWYGCHLASELMDKGYEVTVFEGSDILLGGAAKKNQLRLHQGFHYSRSFETRLEAREGFNRFIAKYPTFSNALKSNLYVVPKTLSTLDFNTIRQIFDKSELTYEECSVLSYPWLKGIEGILNTTERVISNAIAEEFFERKLKDVIRFGAKIMPSQITTLEKTYAAIIDTTYSAHFSPRRDDIFEATLIGEFNLEIDAPRIEGLTVIDGPFWSIYPTEKQGILSLSHVQHGPLFQSSSESEIEDYISKQTHLSQDGVLELMAESVKQHVPSLRNSLETLKPRFITKKIKPKSSSSSREVEVSVKGKLISVRQGKIDAIFTAEDEVFQILKDI